MYKLFTTILFSLLSIIGISQDISGGWVGEINFNGEKIGLAFNFTKKDQGYESSVDVPVKGVKGSVAEKTIFADSKLSMSFPKLQLDYEGTFSESNQIKGNLSLAGRSVPLNLVKGTLILNRPQEPQPPFGYHSENVSFTTTDNFKLEGTFTAPKREGKYPAVIIVSGSGPQNRDGDMFGHKPYLLLADHLTQAGIAVLRFDERGVGKSEGNFTTSTLETFSSDVESAIEYLKKRRGIDTSNLGLIGHSIGGLIVPRIALNNKSVKYIVLMAAPGMNGDQLMLSQKAAIEKGMGFNESQVSQGQALMKGAYDIIISTELEGQQLKDSLNAFYTRKYNNLIPQNQREALVSQITSNEITGLLRSRPSEVLSKLQCPILAMNGDKDVQVLTENLKAIDLATKNSGNENVKIVELKNLNHLFQECITGLLDEYSKIEQTMAPVALKLISSWINDQVN